MLGVHINPMLDFRDNLKHITIDIRKLAKALAKRLLSPNRKKLVIKQLLKSKYHATHLGVFTDKQLEQVDKILNKAARNALGLTPSFPRRLPAAATDRWCGGTSDCRWTCKMLPHLFVVGARNSSNPDPAG